MKNRYILIMAGGVGSRFWPASRESRPKQFLDILGVGKSLIQLTYERATKIVPRDHILIATNDKYKELTKKHLSGITDNQILCEPSRNNTAPCIAYAALKLYQKDPESVFAVLPSDHVILKEEEYIKLMNLAFDYAGTTDSLLTLGISPTRPDTGYGYIEKEDTDQIPVKVLDFKEKPTLEIAKEYVKSGNYLWNAGMFVWGTRNILNAFKEHAPDITEILSQDLSCYNTKEEQNYINRVYSNTTSISIDYAILERANNVLTIPADIGWSDLGTWNSLYDYLEKDINGNVVQGNVKGIDLKNNFVQLPKNKIAVIKGIENYIIVDDEDVLLIYPKINEQEIKEVRNNIDELFK